ncbi:MAG: amidophosphoribosyltransferase [Candidatus Omnitrophica bacterium]|nr:amidophosphoribosyltransferase [Candidatus Omnitrophota bacterium]
MCGIFGVSGHAEAARLTYLGLYALQHRGEESAGIVSFDGKRSHAQQGMGLVADIFTEQSMRSLRGEAAIGHVRYSTTGSSIERNVQPFLANHRRGTISVAHNGNFTNTVSLREELEEAGSIFQTTMDSEIVVHCLAQSKVKDYRQRMIAALARLEGAYSLVLLLDDILVGARDPHGFRPLCLGRKDGAYVLASETCALDLIKADYVRDIEPGEVVFIQKKKLESVKPFPAVKPAYCIFEFIYFARPDSNIFGQNVYQTRKRLGQTLAAECKADCDVVMPIPDSGTSAALGFAQAAGIPLEYGMIRNHYVGRTFIQPSQGARDFKVKVKLNPIRDVLRGKRVAIIEDSIVRGTTTRVRVNTVRQAGAGKVCMCVSCPPLRSPCFYGIDFPSKKELIAARRSVEDIRAYLELDGLCYLSLPGMLQSMPLPAEHFCTACFTGDYPTPLPKKITKDILEKRG